MNLRLFAILFVTIQALASPTAHAQDTRESAEFKLAIQLYNDGLHAQAEDQFHSFIERFPNTASAVEARFYLGLLQKEAKKYGEAKSTFQDFAIRYRDHSRAPDAWWNLGEIYAAEFNHAEAGEAFAKLKAFHPKSARAPQALLVASGHFLDAGDYENARTVLNAILLEYPSSEVRYDAQFALAELFLATGEAERALREFNRLRTEAVSAEMRPRIIAAIGEAQAQLGNRTEAEQRFREVISSFPGTTASYEAQVKLGDMLRTFRDYDGASSQYDAVAGNTSIPAEIRRKAFIGAAKTAMSSGNASAALDAYERLLRDVGGEAIAPGTYRDAAAAARRAGEFAQAEIWLNRLYTDTLISYDRRILLVEMAQTAREGRNYAAAVSRYRQYLQQFPNDEGAAYALLRIAEIEEEHFRNYAAALEQYAAVIERYGLTRIADDAQYGRARTLEKQDQALQAAEAYRQVLLQYPASDLGAKAQERLRMLEQAGGGDAGKAVEQLAAVIAVMNEQPEQGAVDLLLGRVYLEHIRDFERAAKHYAAAMRKGARDAEAREAAFGSALATIRLAQRGMRDIVEARQRSEEFFSTYTTGEDYDALAFAMFQLSSASGTPTEVLDAATAFLARNPAKHREEVLVAYANAMLTMGRAEDAEKEFTNVIETTGSSSTGVDAWFGRARSRAELRNFDEAIADLRSYENRAPNGTHIAAALLLHGRLLARVGQYEEAVRRYDRLMTDFVYSDLADSARIAAIDALVGAGSMQPALSRSARSLAMAENNPFLGDHVVQEFLFLHAQTLARARERTAAKRMLLRYASEHPDGSHIGEVYFALGQMYRDEGKIDLATAYLQQAGGMKDGSAAQRNAADLLLESGRYDRAITAYERLDDMASTSLEKQYAQSRIVVAKYRTDNLEAARNAVAAFKAAWPDAKPVLDEFDLEQGKYFFRRGDYRQARSLFDDVEDSRTRPLSALAMYWDARCHEAQSKNSEAMKRFDEVIRKHPATEAALESMMSLGRMHLRAERHQDAAMQFKAVVDLGDIPEALLKEAINGLIRSYEEMSMHDVAAEMTRRFIDTWPSDPTTFRKRVNLGVYYYQLRYFDQAITHLESLLNEASPDDQAEIRYYIGESYYYKGDFTQAALEFLKVPFLVIGKTEINWSGAAYYMAGKSYENLSKFDLALGMYEKIIETPGIDAREKAQAAKEIDRVKALVK
ncbi:MAG: tetratricopeptide repeat protein [Bacteroidetes bacterium]|nr:tetratricopeptide repeat protein [Bacteroidota bacterium]